MKKIFILLMTLYISTQAEMLYIFSNLSINYLDWNKQTHNSTTQEDFAYLNLEGGAGWDWGEFYGNASLENPTKKYNTSSVDNQRYTGFIDFDIKVKDGFYIHFQDFFLQSKNFYVNNFVVGAAYKYHNGSNFWIRPFLGAHLTNDTYFDGFNGFMTGVKFNYDFIMYEEKFNIFNWTEIEFARDKEFYEDSGTPIGDSKCYGLNGDLNFWWNINENFSTGMHYRYAKYKLGFSAYQSAFIYTFKYNF